ncbi:probable phosphopantothenoylcysteine decarboxylase [Arachis stenosperma]|uniref:probable phosphopantothenoylcysteine decarboxylase n=1 Tax=Arachis stenosperma TaxID=217475 RepID=UPI0025ACAF08|nr:probable phosphopantothenoylcysteine decarboxylase [Arachis stenosperma]
MASQRGKRKLEVPHAPPRKPRILRAACGCLAADQFALLCKYFLEWAEVKAVITRAARKFVKATDIPNTVPVYTDEYEWFIWKRLGEPVLHIDLANWAEILVISPLSAETLSEIVAGFSDNLLTCIDSIVRAWDYSKPMFVATSMNTLMWKNPFSEWHCIAIDDLGINLVPPPSGQHNAAEMADPPLIYSTVRLSYDSKMKKGQGAV